jgi:hypothetical protein
VQSILTAKERITDYKAVNIFLSSMSRNSLKSKITYQFGLTHFQKFIIQKYPQFNTETILKSLSKDEHERY